MHCNNKLRNSHYIAIKNSLFLKGKKTWKKNFVSIFIKNVYALKMLQVISLLSANVALHIETSQLICRANQLTGFYMRATSALNGLKNIFK